MKPGSTLSGLSFSGLADASSSDLRLRSSSLPLSERLSESQISFFMAETPDAS
jgi:hypothetical protein